MPYQGDSHPGRGRFTTEFSYLRKLPGALILVQLMCCIMGFALALNGAMRWRVLKGHAFFTFVVFISMLSCACWLLVRVLHLDALFIRSINWNKAGLVHNGINALLLMVGSSLMVEVARAARTLKAAGVFGFLGFSAFLAGLVWEAIIWHSNRDPAPGFSTASVIRGLERDKTPNSEVSTGVAETVEQSEEGVSFVGIKPRPVSAFLEQQAGYNGEVSTPMLTVPEDGGWNKDSRCSSAASSTQGEWQMPSSCPS